MTGRDRSVIQENVSPPRSGAGVPSFRAWLVAIAVLAAALRLWSIDFGLPMVTHPDEVPIVYYAEMMVGDRDLNPHWFRYPALIIYLEAGVILAVDGLSSAVSMSDEAITSAHYIGGRLIVVLFSVATVVLVGLLGRRLAPARNGIAGLIAAAMLALSFLHVKDSHYLKPDIPLAFFAGLSLWFTLDAVKSGNRRSWLLAAGAVGLAASCKYNGALVGLVPAAALLGMVHPPSTWLSRDSWRIAVIAGAMAVIAAGVFLLVNPYVLLSPQEFLSSTDGIVAELDHYREGHEGAEGERSWLWYAGELWRTGFGPTLMPLVLVGLVVAVYQWSQGDRRLMLLLVFPLIYLAFIGRYPVRFDRQLMPVLPYLAVLGGLWLPWLAAWLEASWQRYRVASAVALFAMCLAMIAPLVQAAQFNHELGQTDPRYPALDWSEENIPAGAVIAHENYTPPLGEAGFQAELIWSAFEHQREWFQERSVDYLMISSHIYQRYLDDPGRYPRQAEYYSALLASPALAHFDSPSEHTGPDIHVFHIDDIEPALSLASGGERSQDSSFSREPGVIRFVVRTGGNGARFPAKYVDGRHVPVLTGRHTRFQSSGMSRTLTAEG